jgi:inner membrane protein involved in colicin E2 resistance
LLYHETDLVDPAVFAKNQQKNIGIALLLFGILLISLSVHLDFFIIVINKLVFAGHFKRYLKIKKLKNRTKATLGLLFKLMPLQAVDVEAIALGCILFQSFRGIENSNCYSN